MTRLMLSVMLIAFGALSVGVWLVDEIPYPNDNAAALDALLTRNPDCPPSLPCVMGVHVGRMSYYQALEQLEAHPWVGDIETGGQGYYNDWASWGWSGAQPAIIDAQVRGLLVMRHARVYRVSLPLKLAYGEVREVFGAAPLMRQCFADDCHQPFYRERSLGLTLSLPPCLASLDQIWHAPVTLSVYEPETGVNAIDVPYVLPLARPCSV